MQIDSSSEPKEQKLDEKWYLPQDYTQWKLFTRIIVTVNPQDNNSTILIIFDEP